MYVLFIYLFSHRTRSTNTIEHRKNEIETKNNSKKNKTHQNAS